MLWQSAILRTGLWQLGLSVGGVTDCCVAFGGEPVGEVTVARCWATRQRCSCEHRLCYPFSTHYCHSLVDMRRWLMYHSTISPLPSVLEQWALLVIKQTLFGISRVGRCCSRRCCSWCYGSRQWCGWRCGTSWQSRRRCCCWCFGIRCNANVTLLIRFVLGECTFLKTATKAGRNTS